MVMHNYVMSHVHKIACMITLHMNDYIFTCTITLSYLKKARECVGSGAFSTLVPTCMITLFCSICACTFGNHANPFSFSARLFSIHACLDR